jgi:hypothetical protein
MPEFFETAFSDHRRVMNPKVEKQQFWKLAECKLLGPKPEAYWGRIFIAAARHSFNFPLSRFKIV